MNSLCILLMFLVMTLLGAVGGMSLKRAHGGTGIWTLIASPWFVSGGILYSISAVLNVLLLKRMPYVVLLPLTSVTYVWSLVLAAVFLKERINVQKVLGIFLIAAGVFCIVH